MGAQLLDEFSESERSDGFNLIPRNPKKVFLLKVNPLIHHLPTELAVFKIRKWRVPSALAKMDDCSVVVLWQDGPNAGIYGIAVPYARSFMTDSDFFTPATHLEFYRYGFKEVKLRCIYIPPTPILSTTLQAKGMVVREMKRPRAKLSTGCKLTRQAWSDLYDLMRQGKNSGVASAVEIAIADQHPVVEFIQRRENHVVFYDGDSQLSDPYALAQRIWNVLTQSVVHGTSVNNISLSELFGVTLSEIRTVIALIDEICLLENLPRLASPILLNHESADLYEHPHSTLDKPLQLSSGTLKSAARNFDWDQVPNPFDFTLQCSSQKIMRELETAPTLEQAADIYKVIKVRGTAQQIFARLMRRLYDRQCAFCGFSMPFALEAAHIKPWTFCTPGERLLASNGLLLCSVHHKLFDAGLITLSVSRAKRFAGSGYVVRVLAPDSLLCISKADVDYVKKLDGVAARLPQRKEHRPKAEFLNFRKNWVAEKILHHQP
jgi:putative restriction endonuclease